MYITLIGGMNCEYLFKADMDESGFVLNRRTVHVMKTWQIGDIFNLCSVWWSVLDYTPEESIPGTN